MHVPALCQVHVNETLIHTEDLQAYKDDKLYFQKHPEQLFRLEEPFRRLARAWADRVAEDQQAQDRILSLNIHARVLLLEYPKHFVWVMIWYDIWCMMYDRLWYAQLW